MKNKGASLLCLVLFVFASCERVFIGGNASDDPINVFDYLWNKVDQQYSFFDLKGVDWDSVYEVYRPKVYEEMDDDSLFKVCVAMLNTLNDGHTYLISDYDEVHNDSVFYRMYAERNIDEDVVMMNYLTFNHHKTGSFLHNSIHGGKVAYIRYSSFMDDVAMEDLEHLLDFYGNCEGIILDLRQNHGGSIDNIRHLLSILDNHGQELYRTQIKAGPEHDKFTELSPVYASETNNSEPYTKPVAVLIDRGTYSAASFFSICTMAYDNVWLFGDYSGGGLGLPNAGVLPNTWIYRFSITRTIALDGGNYENGVPPDVHVILDPVMTAQGIDNVIEAAVDWILE